MKKQDFRIGAPEEINDCVLQLLCFGKTGSVQL